MKWSWFKVPVKVKQINEYLFSDTVQSQKTKSGSDEISQGQYRGYPSISVLSLLGWWQQMFGSGGDGLGLVETWVS